MSFHDWLQNIRSGLALSRGYRAHSRRRSRRVAMPLSGLESLEDRKLLTFSLPVEYNTGAADWSFDMVTADFNNDDHLDLATANYYDSTVSVLLGDGQGGFGEARVFNVGHYPWSVAVGDFNEDGKLDLATANQGDYTPNALPSVSVLFGNGDGTFGSVKSLPTYGSPKSVAVGDFNADGHLDLGVGSSVYGIGYYHYASVHTGDGAGNFAAPKTSWSTNGYYVNGVFESAVAADLNGDGADDLVLGENRNGEGVHIFLGGDASGFLQHSDVLSTGGAPVEDVAVGDLNGDGFADIVTANTDYYGSGRISVFLNDGQGGYAAAQGYDYAGGFAAYSLVLGDFSGDGHIDIVFGSESVLRGYGDGTFSAPERSVPSVGAAAWTAGDFNGDGWLDVAAANYNNTVSVLINDRNWGPALPLVSVSDATVTEGNTGVLNATFTVTLSQASNVDVTVHYDTAAITATSGSDYTAASGLVTIPAGQLSRTFTVAVKGDRLGEATETFAVNLSTPTNATIGDGQGIGTIVDNEPRISISDVTRAEGRRNSSTSFTFTVTLSAAYDQPVTVSFRTVDGTAKTSGSDYTAKSGTLTFAPGETTKTITISVKGDSKKEANENFYLDLFGLSSNALFTKFRGIGTILNDD